MTEYRKNLLEELFAVDEVFGAFRFNFDGEDKKVKFPLEKAMEMIESDAETMEKKSQKIQQLEPIKSLVEQYISKHRITCSESIYQMDKPQVDAIRLADDLCKLVGYINTEEE